jgi:hypothetical protein
MSLSPFQTARGSDRASCLLLDASALSRWGQHRLIWIVCRHRAGRAWDPWQPMLCESLTPIRTKRCRLSRKCGADGKNSRSGNRQSTSMHLGPLVMRHGVARRAADPPALHGVVRRAADPPALHGVARRAADPPALHAAVRQGANPPALHAVVRQAADRMPPKRNWRLHIPNPKRLDLPSYEMLRSKLLIRTAKRDSKLLSYRCKRHLRAIPLTLNNNKFLGESLSQSADRGVLRGVSK